MATLEDSKESNLISQDIIPKSFTHKDVQATSTPVAEKPGSAINNNESVTEVASNLVSKFKDDSSDDSSEESQVKQECSRTESVLNPPFSASLSSTCSSYRDADSSPDRQTDSDKTSTVYGDAVMSEAADWISSPGVSTDTATAAVSPPGAAGLKSERITVPIMGYEIMEQRARFTVCNSK